MASYWQRYCAKNDTIGFFGPLAWRRVSDDGPPLGVRSGALVRERSVHLEAWAVQALATSLAALERLEAARDALAAAPSKELAVLSNGIEMPYVERGDPDGVPVVLLHAWLDSRRYFGQLIAVLPQRIRAFAFDQRGYGDAAKPAEGYGLRDFAEPQGACARLAYAFEGLLDAEPPLNTGRITAPTLTVWGRVIRCFRVPIRRRWRRRSQARVVIYAGVGNLPVIAAPERVAADLTALCNTVAAL